MAGWNNAAVRQLLESRDAVRSQASAEALEANDDLYAFLAQMACGRPGEVLVKVAVGMTLFGCAISYLVAAIDLALSAIGGGGGGGERFMGCCFSLLVVLPLSLRPFSFLAYTSVAGLLALSLAFVGVIVYGTAAASSSARLDSPNLFATSPGGLAEFFGVASFCFGVPPLAFPIEGSMRRPERFPSAMWWSMAGVALLYIITAETVAILYPAVPSNVLFALPMNSPLATAARLLVALVCLLSYPLAMVPLAGSVEMAAVAAAEKAPDPETTPLRGGRAAETGTRIAGLRLRAVLVRIALVLASGVCATVVPCFGVVISFIGAFSVALVGFVLPPLLHLCLVPSLHRRTYCIDLALLILGTVATIVSSFITLKAGFLSILLEHKCP